MHEGEHSAEAQLESALATLRSNHNRITAPRRAILSILIAEHGPFTTDEIHSRMEPGLCDLVTVYRCVAAMEELNLVRRCDFGDGVYRYEFNTGDHHHHHIVCRQCHSVRTLDFCVADGLERMARQMGYSSVTHTLEIFGICSQCRTSKAAID